MCDRVFDVSLSSSTGVIERLAQDCTPGKWTVGDRVMALLPGGGNAEIVSVHEDHLMPLPKTMTFREAAAIPEVSKTRVTEAAAIPEVGRSQRSSSRTGSK